MDVLRNNMIEIPADELKKVAGGGDKYGSGCENFCM